MLDRHKLLGNILNRLHGMASLRPRSRRDCVGRNIPLRRIFPTFLLPFCALAAVSCSSDSGAPRSGTASVVVSLGAFEVLANAIGGDAVTVTNIARGAGDAHELELTPSQSESLRTADLAVLPRRGFQSVVDDASTLRSGRTVRLGPTANSGAAPHFWVDPRQAAQAAEQLGTALQTLQVTSAQRATIRTRAGEVVRSLEAVAAQYDQQLASLGLRSVAAEHAAMEVLGARYGFRIYALSGTAHDAEPTPRQLETVAQGLQSGRLQAILVEPTSNRAVANAAIRAAGLPNATARTHIAVFDDFERILPTRTRASSVADALELMTTGFRNNLVSLCSALECER